MLLSFYCLYLISVPVVVVLLIARTDITLELRAYILVHTLVSALLMALDAHKRTCIAATGARGAVRDQPV